MWFTYGFCSGKLQNRWKLIRKCLEETGICLSDFRVLEALFHKGPLPVNVLGKKILVSSGSTTAAIDRLEKRGLVKRGFDDADRSSRIVHITEAGTDLIKELF